MTGLKIEYRSPDELSDNPANARSHSPQQVRKIAQSIRSFGFNNALLIDRNDCVIAGHGRLAAARLLGLQSVPTVQLEHLTDEQKRAYIIADNRLAELAGWDREMLTIELEGLIDPPSAGTRRVQETQRTKALIHSAVVRRGSSAGLT